jgi:hypothetical protein
LIFLFCGIVRPITESGQYSQGSGDPDCRRGRKIFYMASGRTMQDHARSQKTDARYDALDDPACISIGMLRDGEHSKRRSRADKPKRSYSARFVIQLAV